MALAWLPPAKRGAGCSSIRSSTRCASSLQRRMAAMLSTFWREAGMAADDLPPGMVDITAEIAAEEATAAPNGKDNHRFTLVRFKDIVLSKATPYLIDGLIPRE